MATPPRDIPDVIEPESARILSTPNWLRAGVLGANDGVVSTAAIIFGVAGASADLATILLAGIAAGSVGGRGFKAAEPLSVERSRKHESRTQTSAGARARGRAGAREAGGLETAKTRER